MKFVLVDRGFAVQDLNKEDVRSLLRMIKGAGLNERRDFDCLKRQIEECEKKGLIR